MGSVQSLLDQWSPIPGRKITKCMLVVSPLAFWACDWSIFPMEALLHARSTATPRQTLSVNRSPATKRLGTLY